MDRPAVQTDTPTGLVVALGPRDVPTDSGGAPSVPAGARECSAGPLGPWHAPRTTHGRSTGTAEDQWRRREQPPCGLLPTQSSGLATHQEPAYSGGRAPPAGAAGGRGGAGRFSPGRKPGEVRPVTGPPSDPSAGTALTRRGHSSAMTPDAGGTARHPDHLRPASRAQPGTLHPQATVQSPRAARPRHWSTPDP